MVLTLPFEGEVAVPKVYIVKRALQEAKEINADAVLINMNTPGGDLGSTLKLMEMLSEFEGKTICYVNTDAISAGSYIAISMSQIWFAPKGVMGAAEAVNSTGGNIDESMQRKITSFMAAKVKSYAGKNKFRADVQRAMMDPKFELKIGEEIIKKEGALLTLTAEEAVKMYDGAALLADGIAKDEKDLLNQVYGAGNYELKNFDISAMDKIAELIQMLSPLLILIGGGLIYLEFKVSASGAFAIAGVLVLLTVFGGTYLGGLSGHTEVLVFLLGAILVALDVFVLNVILVAILGATLMVSSLALALSGQFQVLEDGLTLDFAAILSGFEKVAWGMLGSLVLMSVLGAFLPQFSFWKRLAPSEKHEDVHGDSPQDESLKGKFGTAITALAPNGKIEIDGKIYEASAFMDNIEKGMSIVVVGKKDFYWLVKGK